MELEDVITSLFVDTHDIVFLLTDLQAGSNPIYDLDNGSKPS